MAPTKDELKARVEELGLTVTRPKGARGAPSVADYERTLEEAGAGIPKSAPAEEGTKTFTVRGPYRVFGRSRGETITGEVRYHGDTGDEILVVGAEWAVLQPLKTSGWLEESKGD